MQDKGKTKGQLVQELELLRKRVVEIEAEQELTAYYDDLPIHIVNADINGNITYVNKRFQEDSGYSAEEVIGKNAFELNMFPSGSLKLLAKRMQDRLNGKPGRYLPLQFKCKDDSLLWVEILGRMLRKHGVPVGFQITAQDITERMHLQQKLKSMATQDALTGLPNRTLLCDRFDVALANAQRKNKKLAIMSLDLDKFKIVNDSLGHDIGDKLLVAAAGRLKGILRKSDTVARMGGDEFVLLLWEVNQKEDAIKVAQKILEEFRQPFFIDGHRLDITASIGIAIFQEDGNNLENLLRNSDKSLYHAKESGRDNFKLCSGNGNL